jgi:hypothetical protein
LSYDVDEGAAPAEVSEYPVIRVCLAFHETPAGRIYEPRKLWLAVQLRSIEKETEGRHSGCWRGYNVLEYIRTDGGLRLVQAGSHAAKKSN